MSDLFIFRNKLQRDVVFITAVTAAFGLAACSAAGVPTLASKVAAERIPTVRWGAIEFD